MADLACFAEGQRLSAKSQKPSALLRAALGKDPSENFESAKRVGKEGLCREPGRSSAKKSSRHGGDAVDGFFAEGWPSAKKCFSFKKIICRGLPIGPRQRNYFIKKKTFAQGSLGKDTTIAKKVYDN